jgi:hypothetical protein
MKTGCKGTGHAHQRRACCWMQKVDGWVDEQLSGCRDSAAAAESALGAGRLQNRLVKKKLADAKHTNSSSYGRRVCEETVLICETLRHHPLT